VQFELRTQVIEPTRKTFQHLIDRYGDRPASRYEEGTIDIQPTANYHYRPLWDPSKEIYSPDYSALKLTDAYSFTDPRQFYYAPYVTARADLHEAFGQTLDYLDKRGMFQRLPEAWSSLFQDVVLPLRHYEAAGQMIASGAARYGWGTTITQCCAYSAFDRIGNAQILSRAGISFGAGTAEPLDLAKVTWLEDEAFQPLRKHVEQMLVEKDWGKAMVALDVTDQLIFGLFYTHLDDAALNAGAASYSLVAQHLSQWFFDQRKWFDALYKAWVSDEALGDDNKAVLAEVVEATLATATAALAAVAAKADGLVDGGAGDALTAAADSIRSKFGALGVAVGN
jgi:phenol hydroxylase P1 protein